MIKFYVKEISCSNCTSRIDAALKEEFMGYEIFLEDKTIVFNDDIDVKKVIDILDDLGFTGKLIS